MWDIAGHKCRSTPSAQQKRLKKKQKKHLLITHGEYYLQFVVLCARPKLCPSCNVQPVVRSVDPNKLKYTEMCERKFKFARNKLASGVLLWDDCRCKSKAENYHSNFYTCAHGVSFRFENPTAWGPAPVWSLELGHIRLFSVCATAVWLSVWAAGCTTLNIVPSCTSTIVSAIIQKLENGGTYILHLCTLIFI